MAAEATPRIFKGMQGDYVATFWPGKNESGLKVYGKNILVAVDKFAAKTGGGIELPEDFVERMDAAAETGCIFAVGPEAFRFFDDGTRWVGEAPKAGDRIYFEKYAGLLAKGVDGRTYRIMGYGCLAAGYDEEYLAAQGLSLEAAE